MTTCSFRLAGALAAALFALPASAGDTSRVERSVGSTAVRLPTPLDSHVMEAMLKADRDKDGTLSREELDHFDVALGRRFKEADVDRDGKLTLDEFERLLNTRAGTVTRR